jgi:23S rRNA pseudouridine1911/1915/1917 synthase
VGDATYGGRRRVLRSLPAPLRPAGAALLDAIDRPALHARALGLVHPFTSEPLSFESPLPADFRRVLALLPGGRSPA